MSYTNEKLEPITTACPGCGKTVISYWHKDNRGMESRPEYVLVADWIYHSECWDKLVEDNPP